MGISTDAILFYGFHLSEDESDALPFGDDREFEDFDTWLEHLAGIDHSESPWRTYPDPDHHSWDAWARVRSEWVEANRAAINSWRDHCQKARESITPIKMNWHCSDELSIPYFYARATRAYRGYPKRIESLNVPDGGDDALCALAATLGIYNPEIGWWLASWWG